MSYIQDIKSLSIQNVLVFVFLFGSTLAPGILIIYLCNNDLFNTLGAFKLVLLAMSLTVPLLTLRTTFSVAWHKEDADVEDVLIVGLILTCITLYGQVVHAYLFDLSFRGFLGTCVVLDGVMWISALVVGAKRFIWKRWKNNTR